jgi:hypothetical protein
LLAVGGLIFALPFLWLVSVRSKSRQNLAVPTAVDTQPSSLAELHEALTAAFFNTL